MPLINIAFTENAKFFFNLLRDIVTFDIIPSDFIRNDMVKFSDT